MFKAPNGDGIQGTTEVVDCSYPVSFDDKGGWSYTGGYSQTFDEGAQPKEIAGAVMFLDESGNEWPLHHLIPADAEQLTDDTIDAMTREDEIGQAYELAKKLHNQLAVLQMRHQLTFFGDDLSAIKIEYDAAKDVALALRQRDLDAQKAAEEAVTN